MRYLSLLALLSASFLLSAQNLVPNPSFEINTGNPTTVAQYALATPWDNCNGGGSADYLSTLGSGMVQLPNSVFGTVSPASGNAIMGFCTYHNSSANFREYLDVQLTSPLTPGQPYSISFHLTNGITNNLSGIATNNIGVYFSVGQTIQTGSGPINVTPQVNINTVWFNSTWQLVTLTFTPTVAYTHIAIGNFYNDANTITQQMGSGYAGYYFIDDIDVQPACFNLDLGPDTTVCGGQPVPLNATISGGTYLWSNGSTGPTLTPTTPGTYWVQVSDASCTLSDTIVITHTAPPVVELGNDTTICSSSSVVLDAYQPGMSYQWNNGSTDSAIVINNTGTYAVQVNNGGCSGTDTIQVTVIPVPSITATNDTTLCTGTPLSLSASSPGSTLNWSTGQTTPTIQVTTSGSYWVEANDGNCTNRDTIVVSFVQPPQVNLGNDTALCNGQNLSLQASNPGSTYQWSTGATNSNIMVSVSGTYWVAVNNGVCTESDTIDVQFINPPVVDLGADTTICQGENAILNSPGTTGNFNWSTSETTPFIQVEQAGTYWLQASVGSCTDVDSIVITTVPVPVVEIGNDTIVCNLFTISLNAGNNALTYNWSTGETTAVIQPTQSGTYWVETANGTCRRSDTISLLYTAPPVANLGSDTSLCEGTFMVNSGNNNAPGYYTWSTGASGNEIEITSPGIYWVEINVGGCMASDTMLVTDEGCEVVVNMPNVFSPNGDNTNDVLRPVVLENVKTGTLYIFNRWGQEMSAVNIFNGWDGTTKGDDCPTGTYFWILEYEYDGKTGVQREMLKGSVTLLR